MSTKTHTASQLYLIAYSLRYAGLSGDLENLYTDKEACQAEVDRLNAEPEKFGVKVMHSLYTLDEYISEITRQARDEGYSDGVDSERRANEE